VSILNNLLVLSFLGFSVEKWPRLSLHVAMRLAGRKQKNTTRQGKVNLALSCSKASLAVIVV
jgi:hypothetical protein